MTEQTDRELLEMAKEAGLTEPDLGDWITDYGDSEASIKRFAALVEAKAAAKEREACAQSLENLVADHVAGTRKSKNTMDWCAADDRSCEYVAAWSEGAAAIRARGNK